MALYRIKFRTEDSLVWESGDFKAKSSKSAWKKALKEWGDLAKTNRNCSTTSSNLDFKGGKFKAELIEVCRREKVEL